MMSADQQVRWPLHGWTVETARGPEPWLSFTECVSKAWQSPHGEWVSFTGTRHEVIGGDRIQGTVTGKYASGRLVPLRRHDGVDPAKMPGFFPCPPFDPALQAALAIGESTHGERVAFQWAVMLPAITPSALNWVRVQGGRIEEAFERGVRSIYDQTGVSIGGPTASVTPEGMIVLMREYAVNLGVATEAEVLEVLRLVGASLTPAFAPMPSFAGVCNGVRISSADYIPSGYMIGTTRSVRLLRDMFVPDATISYHVCCEGNAHTPGWCVGDSTDCTSVRQWSERFHEVLAKHGPVTLHFIEVNDAAQMETRHTRRLDVTSELRRRSGFLPQVAAEALTPDHTFLNAEAIRLFHAGAVFSTHAPRAYFDASTLETPYQLSTAPLKTIDSPGSAPVMIDGVVHADAGYRVGTDVSGLTLLATQIPKLILGHRTSDVPGSTVYRTVDRESTPDGHQLAVKPHPPDALPYLSSFSIDPEECDGADDSVTVARLEVGGVEELWVSAFSVSICSSHKVEREDLQEMRTASEYYPTGVSPMLGGVPGLSTRDYVLCHRHDLQIRKGIVSYSYGGLARVKLKAALSYQQAYLHATNPESLLYRELLDLLAAASALAEARDGLLSASWLHCERSRAHGFDLLARKNPFHNAIQEVSIAVGRGLGPSLPIRVATSASSLSSPELEHAESLARSLLGSRWRRRMRVGDAPVWLLELTRYSSVRAGGARVFTLSSECTHSHIGAGPYVHVMSPLRQMEGLINDAYLSGMKFRDLKGLVARLNDGLHDERMRKSDESAHRLRDPLGPLLLVRCRANEDALFLSVARQAELILPARFLMDASTLSVTIRPQSRTRVKVRLGEMVMLIGKRVGKEMTQLDAVLDSSFGHMADVETW